MSTPYRKKLIEVALPLDVINMAAAREKSIRHWHSSTLHLWWSRRLFATIEELVKWKDTNNEQVINAYLVEVACAYNGLVVAWPELEKPAAQSLRSAPAQETLLWNCGRGW